LAKLAAAAFVHGTSGQIIELLRRNAMTIDELAEELG
jgi:hypothetical protein